MIWDKNAVKRIAMVTVYRTLKLLVEDGVVRRVVLPTGEFLYESRHQTSNRGYFLCTNCMGLSHLEVAQIAGTTRRDFNLPEGYKVEFQEHLLFGYCQACSKAG